VPSISQILNEINYEMVRKLAEGGMGVVYEAHQHGAGQFRKTVAVKLIREEYSAIPEFQKNFIGEARLVADLIHTNIVQTYHLGQIGGQYFMVMEFVGGQNIEQFMDRHKQMGRQVPVDLAAFIVSRVARGLAYAHQKRDRSGHHLNIVHRDIGPKNVLMGYEGDVKLTDFGIAKALNLMYNEEGKVIAGKDEYLSPEQASYAVTDARADLFPLGIVLTEILLGKNIFRSPDRVQQPAAGHRRAPGEDHPEGAAPRPRPAVPVGGRDAARARGLPLQRGLRPDQREARQLHPRPLRGPGAPAPGRRLRPPPPAGTVRQPMPQYR
jgi:serine/threonine-protein kinase